MATPITWAQEVIICDICHEDATYQFCHSCQVKLCGNCINEHVNAEKLLPHDIVPFTKRNEKVVSRLCEIHPGQKCEACCHQCDVLICMKCVIASHQSHQIEEIPSAYLDNMKKINLDTDELQKILDLDKEQSDARESNIKDRIAKTSANFEELERELEHPRSLWHQEVYEIFDKHKTLIKSLKEKAVISLVEQNLHPNRVTQKMLQTIKENKDILRSKTVSKVVNYISKPHGYQDIPVDIDVAIPSLKITTDQGKELSIELGEHKATLTQTTPFSPNSDTSISSFGKFCVIADIQTPLSCIDAISCVGSDEAWIAGTSNVILRFDKLSGSVKESIKITGEPADMSVTQQGELIFTDFANKSVTIVKHGMTETLIKAPLGWRAYGLCCTNNGDILVSMNTEDERQHKIVRFQGKVVKQEIEKDLDGNHIFQRGGYILYLAENTNGDICASDGNAKKVVVVDATGIVRFRYNGYGARGKKYFSPEQIATDSMSQIIVTDQKNDCLHILDQNGHFLQCVDYCGLDAPGGLSVDSKGRYWVGLHSGKLKMISLLKM
ncbi:uncharacterized protein LOC134281339 [Saccostrea cucullata]|uniref:uncharacterized protein LOC134230669 n=1 Tax=Saccostrea cuccullata TaxID=36930 RepID=UPI002ED32A04